MIFDWGDRKSLTCASPISIKETNKSPYGAILQSGIGKKGVETFC